MQLRERLLGVDGCNPESIDSLEEAVDYEIGGRLEVRIPGLLCLQDPQSATCSFSACYHEVPAASVMPPDQSHRFSSRVEVFSSLSADFQLKMMILS